MTAQFYAKIGIYSPTLTPNEVSQILGIIPDDSFSVGDMIGKNPSRKRTGNAWIILSRISKEKNIIEHIDDVLERISEIKNKIKTISEIPGTDVELRCVIHSKDEPLLGFEKKVIEDLAQMGASIDVDLYYWEYD